MEQDPKTDKQREREELAAKLAEIEASNKRQEEIIERALKAQEGKPATKEKVVDSGKPRKEEGHGGSMILQALKRARDLAKKGKSADAQNIMNTFGTKDNWTKKAKDWGKSKAENFVDTVEGTKEKMKGFVSEQSEKWKNRGGLEKFDTAKVVEEIKAEIAKQGLTSPEEKNGLAQKMLLEAREKHQKELIEKSSILKKPLAKTEKWWAGLDNSRWGKAGKVALGATFVGAATYLTGDLAGLLPAGTSFLGRVGTRVGIAAGMNMAMTSSTFAQFFKGKENSSASTKKKLMLLGMAASMGGAFMISGPLMALVAGGGMVARQMLNKYFEGRIKELEKENNNTLKGTLMYHELNFDETLDPDALAARLNHVWEIRKDDILLTKILRGFKSLSNGALSMGMGLSTMAVHDSGLTHNYLKDIDEEVGITKSLKGLTNSLGITDDSAAPTEPPEINSPIPPQTPEAAPTAPATPPPAAETPAPAARPVPDTTPETATTAPATPPAAEQTAQTPTTPDAAASPAQEAVTGAEGATPAAAQDLEKTLGADYKDVVIGKGEGIEHAFRKQIEHNIELAKELGFKVKEDGTYDQKDLHEFSGGAAHRLAIDQGYVDKATGAEVRVAEANSVAYRIKLENGEIKVEETKLDGTVAETHEKGGVFEGKDSEKYEYVYKGGNVNKAAAEAATTLAATEPQSGLGEEKGIVQEETTFQGKNGRIYTEEDLERMGIVPGTEEGDVMLNELLNEKGTEIDNTAEAIAQAKARVMQQYTLEEPVLNEETAATESEPVPKAPTESPELSQKQINLIYEQTIPVIFPKDTEVVWNAVKNVSAESYVPRSGILPANLDHNMAIGDKNYSLNSFIEYINKLANITKIAPRGETLFRNPESVESYIKRTLKEAAKMRRLYEIYN